MPASARVAIILHSGTEDHARGLHALLYAQELQEQGIEAQLIFDGHGTQWIPVLADPAERLHALYEKVKGRVTFTACEFCSGAVGTKDAAVREGIPFRGTYQGHPSLASLVKDGWQVITL